MGKMEIVETAQFEIRFDALCQPGTSLCFPCNHAGEVDLDCLSGGAMREYLYARAMMGLEFSYPVVVACNTSHTTH